MRSKLLDFVFDPNLQIIDIFSGNNMHHASQFGTFAGQSQISMDGLYANPGGQHSCPEIVSWLVQ